MGEYTTVEYAKLRDELLAAERNETLHKERADVMERALRKLAGGPPAVHRKDYSPSTIAQAALNEVAAMPHG